LNHNKEKCLNASDNINSTHSNYTYGDILNRASIMGCNIM
jgi:hypothetical protein